MTARYYVGTSGWHYDHWRGKFYPRELSKPKWLQFYTQSFATVELNNSFYHLPSEKAFVNWRDSAPENFAFAVKVSRLITHLKKLKNVEEPFQNFLSRAKLLGNALGPLLYQLPPNLHRDDSRLEAFISLLPGDLNHVFEFRHESWLHREVFDLLRRYNIGFCVYDMPNFTTPIETTADFAYIRFHGSLSLYGGCYSDDELGDWARKILELSKEIAAVFVYFNNDAEGFAVRNAMTLRAKLGETSG